jgi:hypothetical protein
VALHGIDGGDLAAGVYSPAGKLLTGNIGSLCEQQPLKALRAPSGPRYLNIKYYIITLLVLLGPPGRALRVAGGPCLCVCSKPPAGKKTQEGSGFETR